MKVDKHIDAVGFGISNKEVLEINNALIVRVMKCGDTHGN